MVLYLRIVRLNNIYIGIVVVCYFYYIHLWAYNKFVVGTNVCHIIMWTTTWMLVIHYYYYYCLNTNNNIEKVNSFLFSIIIFMNNFDFTIFYDLHNCHMLYIWLYIFINITHIHMLLYLILFTNDRDFSPIKIKLDNNVGVIKYKCYFYIYYMINQHTLFFSQIQILGFVYFQYTYRKNIACN